MKTTDKFNFEYAELSELKSESINGGRRRGRIRRKIKRFFQRLWRGKPQPYNPASDGRTCYIDQWGNKQCR